MPHSNIPEGWVDTVFGAVATAFVTVLSWLAKHFLGRVAHVEKRVSTMDSRLVTVERIAAVHEERHRENVDRLERIENRTESIDGKIDRLIERGRDR